MVEAWIATRHLARCWYCQNRRWALEGPAAEEMVNLYRNVVIHPFEDQTLQEKSRAEFAQWLQCEIRRASLAGREEPLSPPRRLHPVLPGVSVGLAVGVVLGSVAISVSWRRAPHMSANALLVRAEQQDHASTGAIRGVARQTVRIKAGRQTLARSVYWDLQGKRHPRPKKLDANEEELKVSLNRAGVAWDRPISACDYQDWHDHQHVRTDRITQTGDHLLTLTTTVPEGIVVQESITIRDTDFHPVERTIGFRDRDTVEIAELDYSVVPWSAVDPDEFEPVESRTATRFSGLAHPQAGLAAPRVSNPQELDATELAARFVLNRMNADEGEQIEVHRSEQGIEVVGMVHSADRKRELIDQLMTVPGVKVSIRSESDVRLIPMTKTPTASVETTELPDNPSALEIYLRPRSVPLDEVNSLETELFGEALIISTESRSIAELKSRFVHPDQLPIVALGTLSELLYSHHERLQTALGKERAILARLTGTSSPVDRSAGSRALLLVDAAANNLALARELTQTNAAKPRGAGQILSEMADALNGLTLACRQTFADAGENAKTGRKE